MRKWINICQLKVVVKKKSAALYHKMDGNIRKIEDSRKTCIVEDRKTFSESIS